MKKPDGMKKRKKRRASKAPEVLGGYEGVSFWNHESRTNDGLHHKEFDIPVRQFLILGQMPRKSNSRRLVFNRKTRIPMFIKSADAISWTDSAIRVMQTAGEKTFNNPCGIRTYVFYRSRRSDLSVELLKDAMEKAGVVKNDRLITYEENYGFVDKDRPRVIVEVWELPEGTPMRPLPNDPVKATNESQIL